MADPGALLQIHGRIDAEAARLGALHHERLKCRKGCSMCCVDDITVVEVEADNIRRHHADLLRRGVPHEIGMCAFLDGDGACRIYAQRPYVCRSQGLPLRWLETTPGGSPTEHRDICPLNEEGPALVDLPADDCWTIGWAESALAQLQDSVDGRDSLSFDDEDELDDTDEVDEMDGSDSGRRIALRDLFNGPPAGGL